MKTFELRQSERKAKRAKKQKENRVLYRKLRKVSVADPMTGKNINLWDLHRRSIYMRIATVIEHQVMGRVRRLQAAGNFKKAEMVLAKYK